MRRFLLAALLPAFCLTAPVRPSVPMAAVLTLDNGEKLFSTGMDAAGSPLAHAVPDSNYPLTLNPHDGSSSFPAMNPPPWFLSANTADSGWLEVVGYDVAVTLGMYEATTAVDLTGIDVATLSIDGAWITDNHGHDIIVNGVSTGFTNDGQHQGQPGASPANLFSLRQSNGLVAGPNTIVFRWENEPFSPGNPTLNPAALRVEFTAADPCFQDLDDSGAIDVGDLLAVLGLWGPCEAPCPEDLDLSGAVDVGDLLDVLAKWGSCP
ncbi:MAG: hypothetical protein ACYTG1_05480 [Planctomycetota bacterium]|jgi:hypothetical protein